MNLDNYPDDIRSYDNNPSSPLFVEPPECDECGELSVEEDFYLSNHEAKAKIDALTNSKE